MRSTRIVALAAATAIVLGACGGGSDKGRTSSAAPGAPGASQPAAAAPGAPQASAPATEGTPAAPAEAGAPTASIPASNQAPSAVKGASGTGTGFIDSAEVSFQARKRSTAALADASIISSAVLASAEAVAPSLPDCASRSSSFAMPISPKTSCRRRSSPR